MFLTTYCLCFFLPFPSHLPTFSPFLSFILANFFLHFFFRMFLLSFPFSFFEPICISCSYFKLNLSKHLQRYWSRARAFAVLCVTVHWSHHLLTESLLHAHTTFEAAAAYRVKSAEQTVDIIPCKVKIEFIHTNIEIQLCWYNLRRNWIALNANMIKISCVRSNTI
jgi:hypothetical protein